MIFSAWQRIVNNYLRELLSWAGAFNPLEPIQVDDNYLYRALLISRRMVTMTLQTNASSWREAASKSSKGKRIYEAIRQERLNGHVGGTFQRLVEENASLIRSLPLTAARRVTSIVSTMQGEGLRASAVTARIQREYPHLLRSQAHLIARTEVSKAESAFTRARSQALGLNWYEWETSHDTRVRPSHKLMNAVLVNWNDPPSPEALLGIRSTLGKYNAGNCPNCRCPALPLITVDDVRWPHKVYQDGRIRMMTRAQFLTIQ